MRIASYHAIEQNIKQLSLVIFFQINVVLISIFIFFVL